MAGSSAVQVRQIQPASSSGERPANAVEGESFWRSTKLSLRPKRGEDPRDDSEAAGQLDYRQNGLNEFEL